MWMQEVELFFDESISRFESSCYSFFCAAISVVAVRAMCCWGCWRLDQHLKRNDVQCCTKGDQKIIGAQGVANSIDSWVEWDPHWELTMSRVQYTCHKKRAGAIIFTVQVVDSDRFLLGTCLFLYPIFGLWWPYLSSRIFVFILFFGLFFRQWRRLFNGLDDAILGIKTAVACP